jgi:hypothetical protein
MRQPYFVPFRKGVAAVVVILLCAAIMARGGWV